MDSPKISTPKTKSQPWKKIPCGLRHSLCRLTGSETKLWLALALHSHNGNNHAWPSRPAIRKETGLHLDLISRLRSSLVKKHWLRCIQHHLNSPPVYEVVFPDEKLPPTKRQRGKKTSGGHPEKVRAAPRKRQGVLTKSGHEVEEGSRRGRRRRSKAAQASPSLSAFDSFWHAYPRKVGKPSAMRAWNKVKKEEIEQLMSGLRSWEQSDQWQDAQYIPHPSTFLNDCRWQDDPPTGKGNSEATTGRGPRTEGKPGKCSQCGTETPTGFARCYPCITKRATVNQ